MRRSRRDRVRWSVYAGLYLFVCGTAVAFLFADILVLLASVIGLPERYALGVLASPAFVVGAVVWWGFVEQPRAYSYLIGGAVGLVTALITGLVWTVRFVTVWGFEMLAVDAVFLLVGFVLGMVVIAGGITGLPLMYARRHLDHGD